jgi:POT family proton-dependent oligopeptide transporter
LALVGGIIADRSQDYKGTIQKGLLIMALGYILLAIPVTATSGNISWLLPFTCIALAFIAFGNGLFKGNLQAIVGQMYDNLEAEEAKKGPEALELAKSKRDSGFQIFYVFINIGGLIAPFVAPLLREWWLKANGFLYNANLPELCHKVLNGTIGDQAAKYDTLSAAASLGEGAFDPSAYLEVFNQGVHFSFFASVAAMIISLAIFLYYKKIFPTPQKHAAASSTGYTEQEKIAMAKDKLGRTLYPRQKYASIQARELPAGYCTEHGIKIGDVLVPMVRID